MITATKTWRRWCGPRSELVRATELAADVLRSWTEVESTVQVRIEDRNGLTETSPGTDLITSRHPAELGQVTSVSVTVKPDWDEWWKKERAKRERARTAGDDADSRPEEKFPSAEVTIRVAKYDTELKVEGDDRTGVEGLTQRLAQALGRAAANSPGFGREFFLLPAGPVALLGAWLGYVVTRWLHLASRDDGEAAEIGGVIIGAAVAVSLLVGLWWLFPPIEMFDEGGAGRARRFRGWILGAASAIVVALVGSFLYDQLS